MLDTEGAEVIRDAIANDKLTPMSKLTEWTLAFGVSAAVGESLDIEECMGRKALAQVTNIEKNDRTYDRIASLLPAPKTGAPQKDVDISKGKPIVEWWTFVRAQGHTRSDGSQSDSS